MNRVDVKAILADPEQRVELIVAAVQFLCDVEGHQHAVETYVWEGWWHPNCKSGQVHEHPDKPGRNWSAASHRSCERVYTKRSSK